MNTTALTSITMAALFSFLVFNQQDTFAQKPESIYLPREVNKTSIGTRQYKNILKPKLESYQPMNSDWDLTFIPIGTSSNAYGISNQPGSYLWADPWTVSVVFTFMDESGNIAYSLSTDCGKEGTWETDIPVNQINARYPQGGIYNPGYTSVPGEAYYTYFSSVLPETNNPWYAYTYGVNPLTETISPNPTQHYVPDTTAGIHRNIPHAYTVTTDGKIWVVDCEYDTIDGEYVYTGNLIINKGEFNESIGDFEYDEWLFPALEYGDKINDIKIEFSHQYDYEYGYILIMSDVESNPLPYTYFSPVLYFTYNGGVTWSEEPIRCQLGGINGLDEVKDFINEETIIEILGYNVDRDSIYYNLGYHADMVIDDDVNCHITGIIALADYNQNWYPVYESMGSFHLRYDYNYETWQSTFINWNKTFSGDLGGVMQYNNPQVSIDKEPELIYFSWIDTDLEGIEENIAPDIYLVFYDLDWQEYSNIYNITAFTQGMWSAYYGMQSKQVFTECFGYYNLNTDIPLVYAELNPENPLESITYWYIYGCNFYHEVYYCYNNINEEINRSNLLSVSQNVPNPFRNKSSINIHLEKPADISIEVINLTGQQIFQDDLGSQPEGRFQYSLNGSGFSSGVYYYTVEAGNECVTKKMIVR